MHHIHHHQHRHPTERSLRSGHMEHPSKRRRVERRNVGETSEVSLAGEIRQEAQMLGSESDKSRGGLPKLVLPPSGDKPFNEFITSHQEAEPSLELVDPPRLPVSKLELRQVPPPVASVANSAVNKVADATSGALLPSASNADSNTAAPPSPSPTAPGTVQPPAAIAAQDARNSALAAEVLQAKEDDRLPPPPGSPANSPTVASTPVATKPSSIQLQVSGSNSQQVLSSPPTPLPASPAPSLSPSAPSSYFTSSPATLGSSALLPSQSLGPSTRTNSTSILSTTSLVTTSPTITITHSTSSIDSALLAELSASRSSAEAKTKSVTQSPNSSGSSTESLGSQTTMMTMTSSLSTGQSSASGNNAIGTGAGVGGIGGTSNTSGAPSSTSTAASGSGGGSNTPATPALIGGIVGGISGLVLILLAALLLLRWKKGRLGTGERRTISPPMLQTSAPGNPPQSGTGTSGNRSSTTPIAAAGLFGRFRPSSSQTATTTDTAPSERGFQKISGRKLPSVLTSGGDGYGAAGSSAAAAGAAAAAGSKDRPPMPQQKGVAPGQGPFAGLAPGLRPSTAHSLSGSSFYRDSKGFYGGVVPESTSGSGATDPSGSPTSSSPTFPSPLAVAGGAKDPGNPSRKPTIRPGPARQPVMHEAGTVPPPRPPRATPPPPGAPIPRDLVGRSHPSEDGSRASRFRESTTPP